MKYLVQKIKQKERSARPSSESEYVKRLQEEDTGLEEVRIAGIPTESEAQQDPQSALTDIAISAGSAALGPIINTAKGPIMAAVKNKPLEDAKKLFDEVITKKVKDLKLLERSGKRMDIKNLTKPEPTIGKVKLVNGDHSTATQKVIAVGEKPKKSKLDTVYSQLGDIDPKVQRAFNAILQQKGNVANKAEFVKRIIKKYNLNTKE